MSLLTADTTLSGGKHEYNLRALLTILIVNADKVKLQHGDPHYGVSLRCFCITAWSPTRLRNTDTYLIFVFLNCNLIIYINPKKPSQTNRSNMKSKLLMIIVVTSDLCLHSLLTLYTQHTRTQHTHTQHTHTQAQTRSTRTRSSLTHKHTHALYTHSLLF